MGTWLRWCPICDNRDIERIDTSISEFVRERIESGNIDIHLCHCKCCSFAFYDYRFSVDEEKKLYYMYRDENYQKQREKYEYWYTKKVNNALNNDLSCLKEQQRVINKVLQDNGFDCFENALDYGGNEGASFIEKWGTQNKYVYDISGCKVLPNIIRIESVDDLVDLKLDFIMCNMTFEHLANPTEILEVFKKLGDRDTIFYVEVPSEFPFTVNKFSVLHNLGLLLNRNFSIWKLFKSYLKQRREPYMTMKEHINFYTPKSLRAVVEKYGFAVIDIQENYESAALGKANVLSVLFKRPSD